jgi:ribosomal protein L7Ae-like RNA K-turn-binding protein
MDKNRVIQSLGLCQRAGKIISGEQFVLEAIKAKKTKLVFLASDAGINTTKRITDKTAFYKVKLITDFCTEELNNAIGKRNRKVVAISDKNFANMIEGQLNKE